MCLIKQHAMEVQGSGQLQTPAVLAPVNKTFDTHSTAVWVGSELTWTLLRKERNFAPARNQTPIPNPYILHLVTIFTELSRIPNN
jgi:hypothetical protein